VIHKFEVQKIALHAFDKYFSDKAACSIQERSLLLDLAWEWVCPDCGQRNFVSMTSEELSREENEEVYRLENELEDWQEVPEHLHSGMWNTCPKHVTCTKCHSRFRTTNNDPLPGDSDGENFL
jgi:rubredoxin